MNRLSRTLIELALEEDLSDVGDLTSLSFVNPEHRSTGRIVAREPAVVSGQEVASAVASSVSTALEYHTLAPDGSSVEAGAIIAEIAGPTQALLTAERTLLNFLQRLCGIATVTRAYREKIEHTSAVLLDTRKTTPGMRELEKEAVRHGGGQNHRMGLFDAVMVKDNHLVANSSPVDLARVAADLKEDRPGLKIEVEADRLDQVESFLAIDEIDVILLDNMTNAELAEAVKTRDQLCSGRNCIELEASGGVNLDTIAGIAETGVDYISVGALTHSVRSIDLGLDLQSE